MSPDVFLHNAGVRYDNIDGVSGSPAEIVQRLQDLNMTRQLINGVLVEAVYRTPNFTPVPMNPDTFSPLATSNLRAAIQKYQRLVSAGADLSQIHAAVDEVNAVRMVAGGAEWIPASDFQLISGSNTPLGALAKAIKSQRRRIEEGETPVANSLVPWFDTPAAYQALLIYNKV